jgi:hypothetical protein
MHRHEIPRVVAHATTAIKTEVLAEKGIGDLRVISESKFLHLVRRIVEDSIARRFAQIQPYLKARPDDGEVVVLDESLEALAHDCVAALGTDPLDPDAYRERWNELREKHVSALETIEARLSSLSETVRGVESSLSRGAGDDARRRRRELRGRAIRPQREAPAPSDPSPASEKGGLSA